MNRAAAPPWRAQVVKLLAVVSMLLQLPSAHADTTETCDTRQDLAFSHVLQW
jgi:hypothetical protein